MRESSIFALLALLTLSLPAAAQVPTIDEMEANPSYKRVESRNLAGECEPMEPLQNMIRSNDRVKKITQIGCSSAIWSPAPGTGLFAFVDASGKGVFFQGEWEDDGDFNIVKASFDQQTWFPASKGRVRMYKSPDGLLFVCFAVFERKGIEGVAFRFVAPS